MAQNNSSNRPAPIFSGKKQPPTDPERVQELSENVFQNIGEYLSAELSGFILLSLASSFFAFLTIKLLLYLKNVSVQPHPKISSFWRI